MSKTLLKIAKSLLCRNQQKDDWTKLAHVVTTTFGSDFSCAKEEIKRSNKKTKCHNIVIFNPKLK